MTPATPDQAAKPLYIKVHDTDNVAIVVNSGGLPTGTVFDDGLTLRIERASARVLGKPFDLLARQLLEVDDFKPMPIQIGMSRAARR